MVLAPPSPVAAPPPADLAAGRASAVAFHRVAMAYGTKQVLGDVTLTIPAGAFTVVYGPPAAGKSVLMRLLMGLETPTAGRVTLRDRDVTGDSAADRNIGYIPQSFALYPHLSVRDNIAYPLKLAAVAERDVEPIVRHAAAMLRIGDLLKKRPDQLSGGQKQRVAIARGLAKQADIFVFDDPLAGLDFKLREQLVEDLRDLQQEWRATFLYTTSDAIEALTLADHLAVLDGGVVVEHGPPEQLYREPKHLRTLTLVGFPPANVLPGRLARQDGGAVAFETSLFSVPVDLETDADPGPVVVGIRPEALRIATEPTRSAAPAGQILLPGRVLLREDLGGEEIVYVDCGATSLTAVDRDHADRDDLDADVVVRLRPSDVVVFDAASGDRLGRGRAASPLPTIVRSAP